MLITASSAGLGASVAHKFAAEGALLSINYNSSAGKALAIAKNLEELFKTEVLTVQADVTNEEGIKKMVDATIEKFGRLDVVVSNVGWTKIVSYEDLDALDDDLWDGCFNTNIKAHFKLYKYSRPFMEKNSQGGSFIVTASVAGRIVYGSSIPYAVSKAGLIHLVKMLAKTQASNVRVHAVCPGLLMTDWGKQFSDEKVQKTLDLSPLHVLADVDETALHYPLLAKLTTSTGTIVGIDGGISI